MSKVSGSGHILARPPNVRQHGLGLSLAVLSVAIPISMCGDSCSAQEARGQASRRTIIVRGTTAMQVIAYEEPKRETGLCRMCEGSRNELAKRELVPGQDCSMPACDYLGVEIQMRGEARSQRDALDGLIQFLHQYPVREVDIRSAEMRLTDFGKIWGRPGLKAVFLRNCRTEAVPLGFALEAARALEVLWVDDEDQLADTLIYEMIRSAPQLQALRLGGRRWSKNLVERVAQRKTLSCLDLSWARNIAIDREFCSRLADHKLKHLIAENVPGNLVAVASLRHLEALCIGRLPGHERDEKSVTADLAGLLVLRSLQTVCLPEPWASTLARYRKDVRVLGVSRGR